MQKILTLIVISVLLTSCLSKTEVTPKNNNTWAVVEDTTNDDTIPVIDDKNDGTNTVIIDDNTTWDTTNTDENTPETNSADEQILEDEVNALLDEFIDSLDNYDK